MISQFSFHLGAGVSRRWTVPLFIVNGGVMVALGRDLLCGTLPPLVMASKERAHPPDDGGRSLCRRFICRFFGSTKPGTGYWFVSLSLSCGEQTSALISAGRAWGKYKMCPAIGPTRDLGRARSALTDRHQLFHPRRGGSATRRMPLNKLRL